MKRYAETRKILVWNSPLLRLTKCLAGVLYRQGYRGQTVLWEAVADRLPDISLAILETSYTLDDAVREAKEDQDRDLTLNRLYGRAQMVYRPGREEVDAEFEAVVRSLVSGGPRPALAPAPALKEEEQEHTTPRSFPPAMGDAIFERDGYKCVYCLCTLGPGMSPGVIDHLVPWAGGGESVPWNGKAACSRCNAEKGDMDVIEYMRLRAVREQERGRRIKR